MPNACRMTRASASAKAFFSAWVMLVPAVEIDCPRLPILFYAPAHEQI
jgi:hypothetical protein